MIDRVITFSIRHRAVVIAAGFALALWGVYAVYNTPVDAIPDLSENQVIVFAEWPGHSPQEVEDQVTYPLSLGLQGIAGVRVIRSSSDMGYALLSIILDDGVDCTAARARVAERLAQAGPSLPVGVVARPGPDAAATGQIFWYTVEGSGYDLGRLRAIQDWYVGPQLGSVPGVAEVASVGGHATELQIELDPRRLAAHGVAAADVATAVARANATVGGHVLQKSNAEYLVRTTGAPGMAAPDGTFDLQRAAHDLEQTLVPAAGGTGVRLGDLGRIAPGPAFRRGVLEKEGNEVTGGVVLMRQGENPLEVTRRLKQKLLELRTGLPKGVRVVPFYDRTPLIEGAVHTVTATLVEAIVTAAVCIFLVLLHVRTSFIIAVTLPLAALSSFVVLWVLRRLGIADVQTNAMSLAGIAISVGVLVDASIVMAENVMHVLREHHGDRPVRGDTRPLVLPACLTVGRPIFFSVVIMLLSFLPVFALGGMEGKMFRPLAFTKSFALAAVAALAVTLVPALCTVFIRGRLRREEDSWVVHSVLDVYRPVLGYFLRRPAGLAGIVGVTFLLGVAPVGSRPLLLVTLFAAVVACGWLARTWRGCVGLVASLVLVALVAEQRMRPLETEYLTPLDEGMVMDMPITVPRASVTQAADDLKARDMVFCRFPEVDMVVGKAGRAETPTDPAPLDMIETMVNFRPPEFWPRRKLVPADAERQARAVLEALIANGYITAPANAAGAHARVDAVVEATLPLFDAQMREFAYQRNQEFTRDLARRLVRVTVEQTLALLSAGDKLSHNPDDSEVNLLCQSLPHEHGAHLAMEPTLEVVTLLVEHTAHELVARGWAREGADLLRLEPGPFGRTLSWTHAALGGSSPTFFTTVRDAVALRHRALWREHVARLDAELVERAAALYTRLTTEASLERSAVHDPKLAAAFAEVRRARLNPVRTAAVPAGHHHGGDLPVLETDPHPAFTTLQEALVAPFGRGLLLWKKDRADLTGPGGELDRVMQMPGWTNVWTMPIQNRVDMLATGVNTAVGVRVLGRRHDDVVRASEAIADALRGVRGAHQVVADPVRDKAYLEVHVDRAKAAALGVGVGDVNDLVETATGGKVVTTLAAGRERIRVRVRYQRAWRADEEDLRRLPVPVLATGPARRHVTLGQVADVHLALGPASIKSENGLLRNYVRITLQGRDAVEFVEEARRVVASQVSLPPGVFVEWTGEFEHQVRARNTLVVIVPIVILLILAILYWTYHDVADALLMLLAVPGAVCGGLIFQWLFGYKFSVTVAVGYIACFGVATSTGIIMLVYLREAVARAGGLANLTLDQLREAVMKGAVHRLRPKLLTEGTIILGLAPMLWATGTGAEIIRPMAAPVLGGVLVADEVIDLLLPVLFFAVRRRRWQRLHLTLESGKGPVDVVEQIVAVARNGADGRAAEGEQVPGQRRPVSRDDEENQGEKRQR